MEQDKLATELLHEIKASARRWFVAFCIMVALEVFTVIGFIWYLTTPTEEQTVTVDSEGGNANYIGNDGDISNGPDNSEDSEKSDTQ